MDPRRDDTLVPEGSDTSGLCPHADDGVSERLEAGPRGRKSCFLPTVVFLSHFLLILFLLVLLVATASSSGPGTSETIRKGVVHTWAEILGVDLWHVGEFVTKRKEMQEVIKSHHVLDT
ncbi:hypothetical protein J437_LFUL011902 [Ladona fulva]|uniref:Uncharacterized protein n=1 Tax=Ladona fulva TaxID=123851 RepID=A0A8K0P6I0_LADFU|nr:hypothetical protein J437_LFUL011902 [Ladona fulva]